MNEIILICLFGAFGLSIPIFMWIDSSRFYKRWKELEDVEANVNKQNNAQLERREKQVEDALNKYQK